MGTEIIKVYDQGVVMYGVWSFCVIFWEQRFLIWESMTIEKVMSNMLSP
jgi:hypothetical protein